MNKFIIVALLTCFVIVNTAPASNNRSYVLGSKNYANALTREAGKLEHDFRNADSSSRRMAIRGSNKNAQKVHDEDDIMNNLANKDQQLRRRANSRTRN